MPGTHAYATQHGGRSPGRTREGGRYPSRLFFILGSSKTTRFALFRGFSLGPMIFSCFASENIFCLEIALDTPFYR